MCHESKSASLQQQDAWYLPSYSWVFLCVCFCRCLMASFITGSLNNRRISKVFQPPVLCNNANTWSPLIIILVQRVYVHIVVLLLDTFSLLSVHGVPGCLNQEGVDKEEDLGETNQSKDRKEGTTLRTKAIALKLEIQVRLNFNISCVDRFIANQRVSVQYAP